MKVFDAFKKDRVAHTWNVDEKVVGVIYQQVLPGFGSFYNGYAVFPERPVKEEGYYGVIEDVDVHGGITFAEAFEDGFVYGFVTEPWETVRAMAVSLMYGLVWGISITTWIAKGW